MAKKLKRWGGLYRVSARDDGAYLPEHNGGEGWGPLYKSDGSGAHICIGLSEAMRLCDSAYYHDTRRRDKKVVLE